MLERSAESGSETFGVRFHLAVERDSLRAIPCNGRSDTGSYAGIEVLRWYICTNVVFAPSRPMLTTSKAAALAALTAAVLAGAWYVRQQRQEFRADLASPPPSASSAASAPAPAASVALAPVAAASVPEPTPSDPLQVTGLTDALIDLLGRKTVASLLQVDDFAHRVVATVDNMDREQVSSRLWPVNPSPGRFTVRQQAGRTYIDPDNGLRYAPVLLLVETVDVTQLTDLYRRMYPMLQDAYVDLGYPKGRFNDRLLGIIDHLLDTPMPAGPLEVKMPAFDPAVQPPRPWVLYQFADPALESLSAGQKWLLRLGPVNERRMKMRLVDLRKALLAASVLAQ